MNGKYSLIHLFIHLISMQLDPEMALDKVSSEHWKGKDNIARLTATTEDDRVINVFMEQWRGL